MQDLIKLRKKLRLAMIRITTKLTQKKIDRIKTLDKKQLIIFETLFPMHMSYMQALVCTHIYLSGDSDSEVSSFFNLKKKTVKDHLRNAYANIGVKSKVSMILKVNELIKSRPMEVWGVQVDDKRFVFYSSEEKALEATINTKEKPIKFVQETT